MALTTEQRGQMIEGLERLGFRNYSEYLSSHYWKRVWAMFRHSGRRQQCSGCGDQRFQLHHVSYKNLGHETPGDLIPLCKECHNLVHDLLVNDPKEAQRVYETFRKMRKGAGKQKKAKPPGKPKVKEGPRPKAIPIICLAAPTMMERKGPKKSPRNGWKTFEEAMGE